MAVCANFVFTNVRMYMYVYTQYEVSYATIVVLVTNLVKVKNTVYEIITAYIRT